MTDFLGTKDLAVRLGVDVSTVYRRIQRGELIPAAYVGKQALFTPEDADALARGEVQLRRDAGVQPAAPAKIGGRAGR